MPGKKNDAGETLCEAFKPPTDNLDHFARAGKAFETTKHRFESHPANSEAAWQFGCAAYDWADFATSNTQRADIANQGIAACRSLIQQDTNSAPGHYYLG